MLDFRESLINSTLHKVLKRLHYPLEVMWTCVRWYVAYPLSLRHIKEMMQERGVFVDHVTVHRWAIKVLPVLAAVFRQHKRPVGRNWRMDETYIKVSGQWEYLYRAVDRAGDTVDFPLTAKRDLAAARRFLERAINLHDVPEKITIDKSGANTAAIESVKADTCVDILMRQNIEQDHRAIKRMTRPMLGFKSFWSARIIIAGIETMHMIRNGQLDCPDGQPVSAGNQVLQPCGLITSRTVQLFSSRLHYRNRTGLQAATADTRRCRGDSGGQLRHRGPGGLYRGRREARVHGAAVQSADLGDAREGGRHRQPLAENDLPQVRTPQPSGYKTA